MRSMQNRPCNLLILLGPTASGKTRVGVELARALNAEIISADSRQVFKGMDIGTGKDLDEYGEIPHHLIDIAEPGSEFSVFAFQKAFIQAFAKITARRKLPLLVGGTGLYLDAVLRNYRLLEVPENPALRAELAELDDAQLRQRLLMLKPEQHNQTDLDDRERLLRAVEIASAEQAGPEPVAALPQLAPRVFGLRWPRETLRQRITARLKERLRGGMLEEVAALHAAGVAWERLDYYGLEYRFIGRYLQGALNRNDMTQQLNSAIHQFAKRQETWFRRMEKHGVVIDWIDAKQAPVATILARLKDDRGPHVSE
jgi:tRNA dimethylallyltransferase